jgi:predicted small metal-binding protein
MVKYRQAPRPPLVMTRQYRCAEVMSGCAKVLDGRDTAEVMARIMTHFIKDHGIPAPPFELVTKAYVAITDK